MPSAFRGLEIDNEGKLARLLNGEITRLGGIQDFPRIDAGMTHTVDGVGRIGHQEGRHVPSLGKGRRWAFLTP